MFNVQMQGRFTLTAHKLDGSSRVVADWFDNLILDNGLNRIPSSGGMLQVCSVGSGTAAPAAGQSQLSNLVASTSTIQQQVNGNELVSGYGWRRSTYRFPQGVATGNLSEVGVGSSSTDLFSRALILDGSGNPTTVTVLADEFLDVTYELRLYWPTTDVTGNITINGVSTAFVMRAAAVSAWNPTYLANTFGGGGNFQAAAYAAGSTLGTIEQIPSGGSNGGSSGTTRVGSYVNNSFSRSFRLEFGLNAVTQPIGALWLFTGDNSMNFQCSFSPAIPKSNQNELNLDVLLSWSRRSI